MTPDQFLALALTIADMRLQIQELSGVCQQKDEQLDTQKRDFETATASKDAEIQQLHQRLAAGS